MHHFVESGPGVLHHAGRADRCGHGHPREEGHRHPQDEILPRRLHKHHVDGGDFAVTAVDALLEHVLQRSRKRGEEEDEDAGGAGLELTVSGFSGHLNEAAEGDSKNAHRHCEYFPLREARVEKEV